MQRLYFDSSGLGCLFKYRKSFDIEKLLSKYQVVISIHNIAEIAPISDKIIRKEFFGFCYSLLNGFMLLDMPHEILTKSFIGYYNNEDSFCATIEDNKQWVYNLLFEAPKDDDEYSPLLELNTKSIHDFENMHFSGRPKMQVLIRENPNRYLNLATVTRLACSEHRYSVSDFIKFYVDANIQGYEINNEKAFDIFNRLESWRFFLTSH